MQEMQTAHGQSGSGEFDDYDIMELIGYSEDPADIHVWEEER